VYFPAPQFSKVSSVELGGVEAESAFEGALAKMQTEIETAKTEGKTRQENVKTTLEMSGELHSSRMENYSRNKWRTTVETS
jgi:hypothetical protein